jgi:hypothetical protein
MSNYEWEHAELVLPSAAVAPLKKLLRDWTNELHEAVRAEAVRMHKEVAKGTRSARLYRERLEAEDHAYRERSRYRPPEARAEMVRACARAVLGHMVSHAERQGAATHQPTVADVDAVVARATNRTDDFAVLRAAGCQQATVRFQGRALTWHVPEGNHAVDEAHSCPLGQVFFAALDKVAWTRGTGGAAAYNTEYARDDCSPGGGANQVSFEFGPRGEEARTQEMGMTLARYRHVCAVAHRPPALSTRRGW